MIQLQKHQQFTIQYLYNSKQRGLIVNHFMGTGKTILGIQFSQLYQQNEIIYIIPQLLHFQWVQEMEKINKQKKNRQKIQFLFYENIEDILKIQHINNKIIIIDEIQILMGYIRKMIINDISQQSKQIEIAGQVFNRIRQGKKILGLTGTPIYYDTEDIFLLINLVSGEDVCPYSIQQIQQQYYKRDTVNIMLYEKIYKFAEYFSKIFSQFSILGLIQLPFLLGQQLESLFISPTVLGSFSILFTNKIFFSIVVGYFLLRKNEIKDKLLHMYSQQNTSNVVNTSDIINQFVHVYVNNSVNIRELDFQQVKQFFYSKIIILYLVLYVISTISNIYLLVFSRKIPVDYNNGLIRANYNYLLLDGDKIKNIFQKYISTYNIFNSQKKEDIEFRQINYPSFDTQIVWHNYNKEQIKLYYKTLAQNLTNDEYNLIIDQRVTNDIYQLLQKNLQKSLFQDLFQMQTISNYIGKQYPEKFDKILELIKKDGQIQKSVIYSSFYQNGTYQIHSFLQSKKTNHFFITNDMDMKQIQKIVELFNKQDRCILILHPKIQVGINLLGVRQFHFTNVITQQSLLKQLMFRAIRFQSHIHYPEEQRHVQFYFHLSKFDIDQDVDYQDYYNNFDVFSYKQIGRKSDVILSSIVGLIVPNIFNPFYHDFKFEPQYRIKDLHTNSPEKILYDLQQLYQNQAKQVEDSLQIYNIEKRQ